MALDLQQSLSDLQALLDGDKLTELGTALAKVKVRSRNSCQQFFVSDQRSHSPRLDCTLLHQVPTRMTWQQQVKLLVSPYHLYSPNRIHPRARCLCLITPAEPCEIHILQLRPPTILRQPRVNPSSFTQQARHPRLAPPLPVVRGTADILPPNSGDSDGQ